MNGVWQTLTAPHLPPIVSLYGILSPGSNCENHEDAEDAEAPATSHRGPQPAKLSLQTKGASYKGKVLVQPYWFYQIQILS